MGIVHIKKLDNELMLALNAITCKVGSPLPQNNPGLIDVFLDDLETQFLLEKLKIGSLEKFTFFCCWSYP